MEEKKMYYINKAVALNWLNRDYVLCNKLPEIDPELFDDVRWSTLRWSTLGEEKEAPTECPECGNTNIGFDGEDWYCEDCDEIITPELEEDEEDLDYSDEFYQYFITNMFEEDVDFMCKHFTGFAFAYSPLLDCWVWYATDIGTKRDYVMVQTDLPAAECKEGEKK